MRGSLGQGAPLEVRDLGLVSYKEALALQYELVRQRQQGEIPDTLLLLEHPPVITLGRSAAESDILAPPEVLDAAGATIERIERGGETTYHGPGQLVGYLIVDLRQHLRSLKRYVHLLEEAFILLLEEHYLIKAGRDPEHRGVWVDNKKITALGVAVQQRVTFHGFAFNVNTDLSHFSWIIPCGISDRGQTSLQELTGAPTDMQRIKDEISRILAELFGFERILLKGETSTPGKHR
ncbi:lipoyl(octanoyl) transferase [Alkalispirochaeta americana]|uniref:Octanoyltransferase n=1 Tax=Alkalispirochaeta americana TaxID=159291 RepID=A0A1N6U2R0_9SPIO|nr:lipoyl(octanoyl) transferase LipB [Alkalispirochaeta americana]SIQ59884.1 lipoyl(octanoyl) transferase [Alkalispirochaeta americana]